MGYDANSPQARKGALGEQIVKRLLERLGYEVEKPDGVSETTPTRLDWVAYNEYGEYLCVEVKTQKKFPYSFDAIPTFKIPLSKYNGYKAEADERGGDLKLCFVSSEDGKIYSALSSTLDAPYRCGGFEFPVQVALKDGDLEICFCADQFTQAWDIEEDDLKALRTIDTELNGSAQDFDLASEEMKRFVAPNGSPLEFCRSEGDFVIYTRRFKAALGYNNSWCEGGFIEQAATDAGVVPVNNNLRASDIPKLLDAFIKKTSAAKIGTRKQDRAQAARELLTWFNSTVIPALYGYTPAPVEESPAKPVIESIRVPRVEKSAGGYVKVSFDENETLSGLVAKLAGKLGLDAKLIFEDLRKLKIRQDPVLSELFEL